MSRIYLDYNATAPIRSAVQDAVAQALGLGNPSAVHAEGAAPVLRSNRRARVANLRGRTGRRCVYLRRHRSVQSGLDCGRAGRRD